MERHPTNLRRSIFSSCDLSQRLHGDLIETEPPQTLPRDLSHKQRQSWISSESPDGFGVSSLIQSADCVPCQNGLDRPFLEVDIQISECPQQRHHAIGIACFCIRSCGGPAVLS